MVDQMAAKLIHERKNILFLIINQLLIEAVFSPQCKWSCCALH